MKTVFTSRIAKIIFAIMLTMNTAAGYGQDSRPDIANGVPCTVLVPGPVVGPANVCPFIGTGDQLTYSVDPLPQATSYDWILPPTAAFVSGQGTNSIVITVGPGFQANSNKVIRVRANFPCGTSAYRLFYLKAQAPITPRPIVAGSTDICAFVGSVNAVSYSINAVPGASQYTWTNPPGTTMFHANPGPNDTIVLLTFASGFTGGNLTVQASNNCGQSGTRTLNIQLNPPSTPGLINGTTNVCDNIAPNGTALTYSVAPVDGAVTYNWTAPAGAVVTHPNGSGANDFTITVLFPAGFSGGAVTVSATNGCGTSSVRSLNVSRLLPSSPGAITPVEISICPNRVYTYSVAALPYNSTSIQWAVPNGGTIINGQGTTSITVTYTGDSITGNVSAAGVSDCGTSVARTLGVNFFPCRPVAQDFSRNVKEAQVPTPNDIMVLYVYPNPTTEDFRVKVSSNDNEQISVRVLDLSGRLLKRIAVKRDETVVFGNDLKPGNYIMEVVQGATRKVQRLVKL